MSVRLVIAGAGGFAGEVAEYLRQDLAQGRLADCTLAGVLDNFPETGYAASEWKLPLLGRVDDYRFGADERVVIAVGTPALRAQFAERLQTNGAQFFTYVHSSAYVAGSAHVGRGVVVCPGCILNVDSRVDDFAALNVYVSLGHGAHVGAASVLSPFCAVNGDASVGKRTFLATRATIFPRAAIGDDGTVDAHSYVKTVVGDGMMVSNRNEYLVVRNRLLPGTRNP
jgi:sugar O-acyltransferase (sialic acid O-acetyltransferase NeuD family)